MVVMVMQCSALGGLRWNFCSATRRSRGERERQVAEDYFKVYRSGRQAVASGTKEWMAASVEEGSIIDTSFLL